MKTQVLELLKLCRCADIIWAHQLVLNWIPQIPDTFTSEFLPSWQKEKSWCGKNGKEPKFKIPDIYPLGKINH